MYKCVFLFSLSLSLSLAVRGVLCVTGLKRLAWCHTSLVLSSVDQTVQAREPWCSTDTIVLVALCQLQGGYRGCQWDKNRSSKWNPGKGEQGLKPASLWFNFDPFHMASSWEQVGHPVICHKSITTSLIFSPWLAMAAPGIALINRGCFISAGHRITLERMPKTEVDTVEGSVGGNP